MTDQQINEAIALALGWRYEPRQLKVANIPIEDNFPWINPQNERCRGPHVPNYCADLNAMHEVEKTLTDEQFQEYYERLYCAACATPSSDMYIYKRAWISAKASVRAEHLLRTIGKWKEESK